MSVHAPQLFALSIGFMPSREDIVYADVFHGSFVKNKNNT